MIFPSYESKKWKPKKTKLPMEIKNKDQMNDWYKKTNSRKKLTQKTYFIENINKINKSWARLRKRKNRKIKKKYKIFTNVNNERKDAIN